MTVSRPIILKIVPHAHWARRPKPNRRRRCRIFEVGRTKETRKPPKKSVFEAILVVGSLGGACFGPRGLFSQNLEKLSKSSFLLFHPGPRNVAKVVPGGLVQQSKNITTPKKVKNCSVVGREVCLLKGLQWGRSVCFVQAASTGWRCSK